MGRQKGWGKEGEACGGGRRERGVDASRSAAPHAPNTACSSGGGGESYILLPVYHLDVSTAAMDDQQASSVFIQHFTRVLVAL